MMISPTLFGKTFPRLFFYVHCLGTELKRVFENQPGLVLMLVLNKVAVYC